MSLTLTASNIGLYGDLLPTELLYEIWDAGLPGTSLTDWRGIINDTPLVQPDADELGTFVASPSGRTALRLRANDWLVTPLTIGNGSNGNFHIFIVCNPQDNASYASSSQVLIQLESLLDKVGLVNGVVGGFIGALESSMVSTIANALSVEGSWTVLDFSISVSSTLVTLKIGSEAEQSAAGYTGEFTGVPVSLSVCADKEGATGCEADIGEIQVYHGALSTAAAGFVRNYLLSKWT